MLHPSLVEMALLGCSSKRGCKEQVDVTVIYKFSSPFDLSFSRCLPPRIWNYVMPAAIPGAWDSYQRREKYSFLMEWFWNTLMQIHILICWRIYLNAASVSFATQIRSTNAEIKVLNHTAMETSVQWAPEMIWGEIHRSGWLLEIFRPTFRSLIILIILLTACR